MKQPYELTGKELKAYRDGFEGGNESNYFPCLTGKLLAAYDRGYKDGQKFGDRKGKPRTLAENLAGLRNLSK